MRKHILFVLALALTVSFRASAQSFLENSQVNGSFQTDAQYYMLDEGIGINDLYGKKFGINGFGKVNYTNGNFSAGIRFEAFLPEMNGFRSELNGVGLANFFATYDNGFSAWCTYCVASHPRRDLEGGVWTSAFLLGTLFGARFLY